MISAHHILSYNLEGPFPNTAILAGLEYKHLLGANLSSMTLGFLVKGRVMEDGRLGPWLICGEREHTIEVSGNQIHRKNQPSGLGRMDPE